MGRTLFLLLKVLNDCQISAAARMLNDGRVEVWLGDSENGIRASAVFARSELADAARWLSQNASRLYPDSHFARVQHLISAWSSGALQS